ncbi:MAG: Cys-tRNA(Pro) deacylase [Candidatus Cryptobacteroides sp.]
MARKGTEKTNAARLLDRAGIRYALVPYEVDENDLAAAHVAESLSEPIERVFKTLVLHGDRTGHIVCVVPGDTEIDLKALAKASGNKKVEMIPMKDLLSVTGYIRGGCSPIGMKKKFPTFINSTALEHDTIFISAGVRGLQIEIAPSDLISFTSAETGLFGVRQD